MKIIITGFLIFSSQMLLAQNIYQANDRSDIDFTAEMIVKDSQYYIIPNLQIKKSGITIMLPSRRRYVDGMAIDQPVVGKIFLRKRISKTYTFITLNLPDNRYISPEETKLIPFAKGDVLGDSINLNSMYPLEIGRYSVLLEFNYVCKDEHYTIQSREFFFEITKPPKDGPF